MQNFEVFDGVFPVFGILTTYEEWNIISFDDALSKKVLFESDSDNDERVISRDENNIIYSNDVDNDRTVVRNLIGTGSIKYDDPNLMKYLVSIMVKCYNRRMFNNIPTVISLLQKDRIVLKLKNVSCSWTILPKSIKMLSLKPPDLSTDITELYLLRDFRGGSEGKVWLGCNKQGNLVILKIPIIEFKKTKESIDSAIIKFENECNMWNRVYGANTAKIVILGDQKTLLMPVVFCCQYNYDNREKKFNATLQINTNPNHQLLQFDKSQVALLNEMNIDIKLCNPDNIALSILSKIAKMGLVHKDVAWRHIGVKPKFKNSHFVEFEPAIIDLSSMENVRNEDFIENNIIQSMTVQLRGSENT
jgi:hypothetical protein